MITMGFVRKIREAITKVHPGPYTIEVTENIGTTGFGTMNTMRYRFVVTDANGAPMKVGYGFSYKGAYRAADMYVKRYTKWGETPDDNTNAA